MRNLESLDSLAEDIAFLHSVGLRVVLVHGGGKQISEMEEKLGIETRFVGGRRVTGKESLEVLTMILGGAVNLRIVSSLRKSGVEAVGLSAASGNIIEASRRPPSQVSGSDETVDFGEVGDVQSVNPAAIRVLLDQGFLPVISPISSDSQGNLLNVNADTAAARLAGALQAEKLILMTGTLGVMTDLNDPTSVISELDGKKAREAIDKGVIQGGMIPKVEESLHALNAGVTKVHIISALEPHSLLVEIFTETGCGTMIMA